MSKINRAREREREQAYCMDTFFISFNHALNFEINPINLNIHELTSSLETRTFDRFFTSTCLFSEQIFRTNIQIHQLLTAVVTSRIFISIDIAFAFFFFLSLICFFLRLLFFFPVCLVVYKCRKSGICIEIDSNDDVKQEHIKTHTSRTLKNICYIEALNSN